jgi:diguanylate cyclase (GGDEF)-like protein
MVAFGVRAAKPAIEWQRVLQEGLPAAAMAALLALFALVITLVMGGEGLPGTALSASAPGAEAGLRIEGGARNHAAQRLRLLVPERSDGEARWVVLLPREPVDAVWLQAPDWRSRTLDFFRPARDEGLLPSAYLFPLESRAPAGGEVELNAVGAMPVSLGARLVNENDAALWMQRVLALSVIVYTGTFVVALIAVALFWSMRDQYFLVLFLAALLAALLFAACNGHLYAMPGLRVLGALREQGVWSLGLLCAAALLAVMQHVANGRKSPRLVQAARWTCGALVAMAALLLARPDALAPATHGLAVVGVLTASGVSLLTLASAVRARAAMAMPAFALLVLVLVGVALRAALGRGLVPDMAWTRYGFQVAVLSLLVVLALALIFPIGAYRQQRDRERDARVESERRMEREAARAGLARVLQARLRELAPADVEWTGFRVMLEHLLPQLPVAGAVVVARAYHGRDVVVTDPIEDRRLTDAIDNERLAQPVASGDGPRNEAVIPLALPLPAWGVLVLQREGDARFADDELALATEFVRLTVLHADEAVVTHALRRTAELDALTGTFNRRSIDQWLARHYANHHARPLSLLFVDIDHFKQVNDVYGHACGDHCLRQVALALRAGLRPDEVLGRYGGEEFIVLLPDTDATRARMVAERLRSAVEDCVIQWQGGERRLTVSIGVATRMAAERTPAPLAERADRALYAAKRAGRNRVSVSPATFLG